MVQAVMRALTILTSFSWKQQSLSLLELSLILGVPKPTVHGLAATLTKAGFLKQDPLTKRYSLGFKLLELGMLQVQTLELNQKGFAPAARLAEDTRLMCRLGLWDSGAVLVTATMYPSEKSGSISQAGPRVPAYCSALGKAVLAHLEPTELRSWLAEVEFESYTHSTILDENALLKDLEETRLRGYSIDREEAVWGVACVGSPVYERDGTVIGAVSVSGSPRRVLKQEKTSELGARVIETAGEISRALGFLPGRPPVARADRRPDSPARVEDVDRVQPAYSDSRTRTRR